MNKLSALALGTALSLSMPLAAVAQDADAGVTLDGGVTTELGGEDAGADTGLDVGVDAGTGSGTGSDVNVDGAAGSATYTYDDLSTAVESAGTADLSTIGADAQINVVPISQLSDDGEMTADSFAQTRTEFEGDIESLRTNVEGNADVVSALEAEGFAADDVVGVWSQSDGSLTVYVDDAAAGGAMTTDTETSIDAGDATDAGAQTDAGAVGDPMGTEGGADVGAEADAEGEAVTQ